MCIEKKVETELFGSKRSNLQLTQSKALKMLDLDYDNFEFVVKQGRKDDVCIVLTTLCTKKKLRNGDTDHTDYENL